jgi:hypothetical protein
MNCDKIVNIHVYMCICVYMCVFEASGLRRFSKKKARMGVWAGLVGAFFWCAIIDKRNILCARMELGA